MMRRKIWLLLVAAEAIVPFDFIKTNKKHLRNKTKHKRNNLNIFLVISRNDCNKKVIIMAMELVVKPLYLGLKFIYQFSKIAGKKIQ